MESTDDKPTASPPSGTDWAEVLEQVKQQEAQVIDPGASSVIHETLRRYMGLPERKAKGARPPGPKGEPWMPDLSAEPASKPEAAPAKGKAKGKAPAKPEQSPPTRARVIGCLYAAQALVKEAMALDPEGCGVDLADLVERLGSEIESAEATLLHDLNHQVAKLLPPGFSYSPE